MKREEIDNLFVDFDEMGFCPTTLCKDAEEYAIQWRNNMRNAIAKHETNLLKEFVEYLKEKTKAGKGAERMMTILFKWIDETLETFLEEK